MKSRIILPLFLLASFFASCERNYQITYTVNNGSDRKIHILYQKPGSNQIDSSIITANKSLSFFVDMGDGMWADGYISELERLPFEYFEIHDTHSAQLKCDESQLNCWGKYASTKKGTKARGEVFLRINRQSFK